MEIIAESLNQCIRSISKYKNDIIAFKQRIDKHYSSVIHVSKKSDNLAMIDMQLDLTLVCIAGLAHISKNSGICNSTIQIVEMYEKMHDLHRQSIMADLEGLNLKLIKEMHERFKIIVSRLKPLISSHVITWIVVLHISTQNINNLSCQNDAESDIEMLQTCNNLQKIFNQRMRKQSANAQLNKLINMLINSEVSKCDDGAEVGAKVGAKVGAEVGEKVGAEDGERVGERVEKKQDNMFKFGIVKNLHGFINAIMNEIGPCGYVLIKNVRFFTSGKKSVQSWLSKNSLLLKSKNKMLNNCFITTPEWPLALILNNIQKIYQGEQPMNDLATYLKV